MANKNTQNILLKSLNAKPIEDLQLAWKHDKKNPQDFF
jgi:hypothetical protein